MFVFSVWWASVVGDVICFSRVGGSCETVAVCELKDVCVVVFVELTKKGVDHRGGLDRVWVGLTKKGVGHRGELDRVASYFNG